MNQDLPPVQTPAPALWNPNAAGLWSLLFSPAFGAFIHARNAETLGRLDEAKSNQKWFYASLAFLGAVALLSVFAPNLGDAPARGAGLVILLVWWLTLGNKQMAFVKATHGDSYPRKSWGKPLLIAFACLIALMVVVFAIAFVLALIHAPQRS